VSYIIRYQLDEAAKPYSLVQDDWQRSIQEISGLIKASDSCLANSTIKYEHNSFELKDQAINPTDKIINLKDKSSDGNVVLKFVSGDLEKKLMDEVDKKVNIELSYIKQITVYPVLIRQLRRLTKEKLFKKIEYDHRDVETNNINVKNIISKHSRKRPLSKNEQVILNKLLVDWNLEELNYFFNNNDLNEQLNEAAHPSLNHPYFRDVIQSDPLNERMYNYVKA
jgi:tRNA U34 5-carboxymethylaminomethyl modifying enzyme MnmG/GidA